MKIKQLKDSELENVLQRFDQLIKQIPPSNKPYQDTAQLLLFPEPKPTK